MKIDAHYYAVLGFCRACGFQKRYAHEVAYTSQFVDDAKINHIALDGDPPADIGIRTLNDVPSLFNMATCHSYSHIKTFNYNAMVHNTCAFHFVPGCDGENFSRKLRCKEDGNVIQKILRDVKDEDDLVKLGMVLHAYADTFSHQGFSGLLSKVNDIRRLRSKFSVPTSAATSALKIFLWGARDKTDKKIDAVMPAYGHGQAMEFPDIPFERWSYEYEYSDQFSSNYNSSGPIDNKDRFRRAFEKIHDHLREYLDRHPQFKDKNQHYDRFQVLYDTLLGEHPDKGRIQNWKETLVKENLFDAKDPELTYDDNLWLKQAFANYDHRKFNRRVVRGARLDADFAQSNWYKYYLAVGWYKDKFFDYCNEEGLTIPR